MIICTITAAEDEQTKSTLEFASRAKRIVNHAEVIIKNLINCYNQYCSQQIIVYNLYLTKLKVNEYLDDRALLKKQKDLIRELQSKIDHYQNDFENSKVERLEREMQVNTYIKVINLALNSYNLVI